MSVEVRKEECCKEEEEECRPHTDLLCSSFVAHLCLRPISTPSPNPFFYALLNSSPLIFSLSISPSSPIAAASAKSSKVSG